MTSLHQPLDGQRVTFTGNLDRFTRSAARQAVEDAGGKVVGSLDAGATLVVAGHEEDAAKRKIADARRRGIPVISEDEFLAMIGTA